MNARLEAKPVADPLPEGGHGNTVSFEAPAGGPGSTLNFILQLEISGLESAGESSVAAVRSVFVTYEWEATAPDRRTPPPERTHI